jgi:NAD(P)-dependent dehydrogenase (short-subunit alcohol dehydrogenase family)
MSGDVNRVVLLTGAASGIGAATAVRLAAPSVGMILHSRRNETGLQAVAEAARGMGAEVATMLGDLQDAKVGATLVGQAMARFGRLDVLISNAGFADRTPTANLSEAALMASFAAISGAFLAMTRAAMPHLAAAGDGRIVAVSSFVAHSFHAGQPVFPASAAAKAALEALARALAIELAPSGTTVNAVVPGFILKDAGAHVALDPETLQRQAETIPLGRLGLPNDVAAVIAFLVSPEASYVTGQTIHVDGGLVIGR